MTLPTPTTSIINGRHWEESMQRLADNFIFRKIKRLRKTASGRTIESPSDRDSSDIEQQQKQQSKNKLRLNKFFNKLTPSSSKTTTPTTVKSSSPQNFVECTESFVLEKFNNNHLAQSIFLIKKQRKETESWINQQHNNNFKKYNGNNKHKNYEIESYIQEQHVNNSNTLNNKINNEYHESWLEYNNMFNTYKNNKHKRLSSNYMTPTQSIIEANQEVKAVFDNQSQLIDDNDDDDSFKSIITNQTTTIESNSIIRQPRSLDFLPNKMTYKGHPINVEISGPVHFLTANVLTNKKQKEETALEKYVDTLCDFSEVVSKLSEKLSTQNQKSKFSYQIRNITTTTKQQQPESPISRPLLTTNKWEKNAGGKITDLTQEWHFFNEPKTVYLNGIFLLTLKTIEYPQHYKTFPSIKKPSNAVHKTQSTDISHQQPLNQYDYDNLRRTLPQVELDLSTAQVKSRSDKLPLTSSKKIALNDAIENLHQRQYYETLPSTKKQPNSLLHKTQSINPIPQQYDDLRETLRQVESDLNFAQYYQKSRSNELKKIENAIWAISERLSRNEPVSKVQAQLNEELLRTRLAEMILNLGSKEKEPIGTYNYGRALKEPIIILKDKLQFLQSFIDEEESIREELNSIQQLPINQQPCKQKTEALKRRRAQIARMTPLIHVVKNKLINLEDVCDVNNNNNSIQQNGRNTPYLERQTIHNLLVSINQEINVIHNLCRQQKINNTNVVDELNVVVQVLSRMCIHLDAIIDTLRLYKTKKTAETKTIEERNRCIEVNLNIVMEKDEEEERVLTFILSPGIFNTLRKLPPSRVFLNLIIKQNLSKKSSLLSFKSLDFNPVKKLIDQNSSDLNGKNIQTIASTQFKTNDSGLLTPLYCSKKKEDILQSNFSEKQLSFSVKLSKREEKHGLRVTLPRTSFMNMQMSQYILMESLKKPEKLAKITQTTNFENNDDEISSWSENVPILFRRNEQQQKVQQEQQEQQFEKKQQFSTILTTTPTIRETAILSDEDESSIVQVYNLTTNCTETFDLRRRRKHALLNAIVFPEIRAEISARFLGDSIQIDVERMSETGRDSVVMISEEFYNKRVKILRKNLADDNNQNLMNNNKINDNNNNSDDDDDKSVFVDTLAKLNVSIMARSLNDQVMACIEEIAWDEISAYINSNNENIMTRSNTTVITAATNDTTTQRGSIVFNIHVAENRDEARSLGSRRSFPDENESEKSFNCSLASFDTGGAGIPTYIIKQGATASITCELNNYVDMNSSIDWFKGKERIDKSGGSKYDRVSHDLLELLIILNVTKDDGNLYSIRVNDQTYPVAYLIIDETTTTTNEDNKFISFPQTMFVMQGQTAILSCQMPHGGLNVQWYHEQDLLEASQDDRIYFEQSPNGWYKIVIEDVDFVDQGTYYACYEEMSTSITLVVEGRLLYFIMFYNDSFRSI